MQCNINAKGKLLRLGIGLVMAVLGGLLLVVDRTSGADGPWLVFFGLTLLGGGIVGILEGWAGWCIVRGLGFRTRI